MTDHLPPFDRLVALLENGKARYRLIKHLAEGSSEAVARIRGTHPGQGAKAMLCQIKGAPATLVLAILPGNQRIDFRKVAESVNGKKASLVSPDLVRQHTGCEIGAVPPFVFDATTITLIAEPSLFEQFSEIAFNAGRLDTSIVLDAQDYLRIAAPRLVPITLQAPETETPAFGAIHYEND